MPVYNSELLIRTALDSLVNQDYPNFELIISDDGSTDATLAIAREYAAHDERITVFERTRNLGPLSNFRLVLDHAQGEFFMWAAHDDYRDCNYISVLLEQILQSDSHDLCCARFNKVTTQRQEISCHPFPEGLATITVSNLRAQLRHSGAPWVYGLYRTERLRPIFARVQATNLVWFWDHLVILNFLLNRSLTGTNRTTIYQVKTGYSAKLFQPKTWPEQVRFAANLLPQVFQILLESNLSSVEKFLLAPFLLLYLEMQVFHVRRWKPIHQARQFAHRTLGN